jgi:TonB family protein
MAVLAVAPTAMPPANEPPETKLREGVQLEITIDEQGYVAEAHIVQGHPLLNRAAIEAVGQWKYTPLCGNDIPLPAIKKVFHESVGAGALLTMYRRTDEQAWRIPNFTSSSNAMRSSPYSR